VRAVWTDDDALSTRINRQVAHYTGQQELADAIDVGLEARRSGDDDTAVVKLGRAVQIAAESGNAEMASLLASVVDVEDAATGRVRLRSRVEAADEMMLETRSTRTTRVRKSRRSWFFAEEASACMTQPECGWIRRNKASLPEWLGCTRLSAGDHGRRRLAAPSSRLLLWGGWCIVV
jgi:von Willebrand factor type A C-terminal domain